MEMRFPIRTWSLIPPLIWLLCSAALVEAGPFMFNLEISPGRRRAAILRNLPRGVALTIQVESDGKILVAVLDSQSYRGRPDTERPIFAGAVEKSLSFTISVEQQGDHYIVLDNRRGLEKRQVRITVQTSKAGAGRRQSTSSMLQDFERRLRALFIFDPFPVAVKECGSPKAFQDSTGILLCTEYLRNLNQALKDKQSAADLFNFSIFHEVGRVLLSKWKEPAAASVEAADELATVLMVMLNQKERVSRISRYLIKNASSLQPVMEGFMEENHPLSPERARNVLKWAEGPETVRKWQKTLVPHMQTAWLKSLKRKPALWTDLSLVEDELAKRKKTSV